MDDVDVDARRLRRRDRLAHRLDDLAGLAAEVRRVGPAVAANDHEEGQELVRLGEGPRAVNSPDDRPTAPAASPSSRSRCIVASSSPLGARRSAVPDDFRRHALEDLALGAGRVRQREVGVRLDVDEARGDDRPLGVDLAPGRPE